MVSARNIGGFHALGLMSSWSSPVASHLFIYLFSGSPADSHFFIFLIQRVPCQTLIYLFFFASLADSSFLIFSFFSFSRDRTVAHLFIQKPVHLFFSFFHFSHSKTSQKPHSLIQNEVDGVPLKQIQRKYKGYAKQI